MLCAHGLIMKTKMNIKPIKFAKFLLLPFSVLINEAAFAEISTLTSEELTDTYIQDTTVIVRPRKSQESKTSIPVTLKVTPLEKTSQTLPEDQTGSLTSISHELSTYDDLNNQRALENNLSPQLPFPTTEFLTPPPSEAALGLIQSKYGERQGVIDGQPIDLTTLPFMPSLQVANPEDIPAKVGYTTTERSFTIKIPNNGNFNSQTIASPNGEIGVNVTPDNIEYTINIPR
jgi:hypothetical protein|tara:strand:+ start:286 stop:978 length:693 start_codon:yes stop_codon:yes gene_type:complete